MYNNPIISSSVRDQLPEFMRNDSGQFVAFLEAYYDWMSLSQITVSDSSGFNKGDKIYGEQTGAKGIVKGINSDKNLLYVQCTSSRHFKFNENICITGSEECIASVKDFLFNPLLAAEKYTDITDIDSTVDIFLESFYKEVAYDFPRNTHLTDEKVLKNIKNFYESKGTLDSYRYLFRIIYQEEIDFLYPRDYVFKPSDNKYQEKFVIKTTKNAFALLGNAIKGLSSSATAIVDDVLETNDKGTIYYNILLNKFSLRGNFVPNEYVKIDDPAETQTYELLPNDNVHILQSGNNFTTDETISIDSYDKIIEINVLSSNTGKIDSFFIEDGGQGYRTGDRVVVEEILDDGYEHLTTFKKCDAFVSKVDQNGSIQNIQIIFGGQDYQFLHITESIKINSKEGEGAKVVPISEEIGKIKTYNVKKIISRGEEDDSAAYSALFSKLSFYDQKNETNYGDLVGYTNPLKFNLVKSALAIDIPYFDSTKSFLSSNQKIQDSEYYQDFSYVIISNIPVVEYKDLIKKLVHTSGSKLFGNIQIDTGFAASFKVQSLIGDGSVSEEFIKGYRKTILEIIQAITSSVSTYSDNQIYPHADVPVYQYNQNTGIKVHSEDDSKQEAVLKMPLLEAVYKGLDNNNINYRTPIVKRIEDDEEITDTVKSIDVYDLKFKRQPIVNKKTVAQYIADNTTVVDNIKIKPSVDFLYQQQYPRNVKKRPTHFYDSMVVYSEIKTKVGFADLSSEIFDMDNLSMSMDNESLEIVNGFYLRPASFDAHAGEPLICNEIEDMSNPYITVDNGANMHIDSEITMDGVYVEKML